MPLSQMEKKVRAALAQPGPDPLFLDRFEKRLLAPSSEQSFRKTLRRPLWQAALLLCGILLALLLAFGPQNVYAAVLRLFGQVYLPEVGILQEDASLRVLAEPLSQTREGISLLVSEAYLTPDKTLLIYSLENVPREVLSKDENIPGCTDFAYLRLPDGSLLTLSSGWGKGYETHNIYAPLPAEINQIEFVLPCVPGSLPGLAPEDWTLQLEFIPAPPELKLEPVLDVPTSTPQVVLENTGTPVSAEPAVPYGLELILDKVLPLEDGYYLLGHMTWTDERIRAAYPGGWAFKAFDGMGSEIPLEPGYFPEAGIETPQEGQWLYRIYGRTFNGPLSLRCSLISLELSSPVEITLDPGTYGFESSLSQSEELREITPLSFEVLDLPAEILTLKSKQQGLQSGFELGIRADAGIQSLPFRLSSPVNGGQGYSAGGSSLNESSGLVLTYLLSDGEMAFPLQLSLNSLTLKGEWTLDWMPPQIDPLLSPTPAFETCFSLAQWKAAQTFGPELPEDVQGSLLFYRSAPAPQATLFLSDLKGNDFQALARGDGDLSPDGSRLVYSKGEDGLYLLDLENNRETQLSSGYSDRSPLWSPDGEWIAFLRQEESRIYLLRPDGSDLQAIGPAESLLQPADWSADGKNLLCWGQDPDSSTRTGYLNLETGLFTELALPGQNPYHPHLSPDGNWLVYVAERIPGRMANGVYLARSDGSQARLLMQLDYWPVGNIGWSPDGRWLYFMVLNTDLFEPTSSSALLDPTTCEVFPLGEIQGSLRSWVAE